MSPEFIDTHVHFWDLKHPTLTYEWLSPAAVHPILGDIDPIKSTRFDAAALWAEGRFTGLSGAVHVQAAVGTADPVQETEWLTALAANSPVPLVLVAGCDLAAGDAQEQLERHNASPLLRGIRDFGRGDYLCDPAFERGFSLLERYGLLSDLDCAWPDMPKARDLARRHPAIPVVLEHIGYPRDTADPEYFRNWQDGIRTIAEAPNVICKVSGLGMNRPGWTVESLRPWVRHCIETFTPDRCVFGTNWPVDRLYGPYEAYVRAFLEIIAEYDESEQIAMLRGNAERLYRIGST
ncbi:MAG TPA: amidohydrolase family protein [Mycobacteriales bacterium]|nr:amidohydrolase family protein [Mycobacteriales bacterium]